MKKELICIYEETLVVFAIHRVPDYISARIWLWGLFMSHSLDERL